MCRVDRRACSMRRTCARILWRLSCRFDRRTTRRIYHQKRIRGDVQENNRSPYFRSPLFSPPRGPMLPTTPVVLPSNPRDRHGRVTRRFVCTSRSHASASVSGVVGAGRRNPTRRFLGASAGSRTTAAGPAIHAVRVFLPRPCAEPRSTPAGWRRAGPATVALAAPDRSAGKR